MNKLLSKLAPEWALRAGLGAMYVYSGIDIIWHPTAWFWAVRPLFRFLPLSAQASFTKPAFMVNFLRIQGVIEIVFALILLAWFLPKKYAKWVAGLTALEMAGILFIIPIDAVTFRDFGLLGAGLALFLILNGGFKEISGGSNSFIPQDKAGHKPNKEGEPIRQAQGGPVVETFEEFMGEK